MTPQTPLSDKELDARRPTRGDSLVIHDHNMEKVPHNIGWILVNGRYLSNQEVESLEAECAKLREVKFKNDSLTKTGLQLKIWDLEEENRKWLAFQSELEAKKIIVYDGENWLISDVVARAEAAEKKLQSFEMRFGSYGTFTHDDILKKLEEQESRIREALPLIEQIQEIIRLTDCPEGYTTPCMDCEQTGDCERSKSINLCLEVKKTLGGGC